MVFAVVTISTIFVYDTQHPHPLARISGCHLATINDATWSPDGNMLVVCSSDGYLTFARFPPGSLGEPLTPAEVPEVVKRSLPCLYDYDPKQATPELTPTLTPDAEVTEEPLSIAVDAGATSSSMDVDSSWVQFITPPKVSEHHSGNAASEIDLFTEDEIEVVSSMKLAPSTIDSMKSFNCDLSPDSHCSGVSSVIGVKLLPSSTDSAMKKRRIEPINLQSSPGDRSYAMMISSSPVCESKTESKNEVWTAPSTSTHSETKKEKKRIVPVLMSSYPTSSGSSASSVASHAASSSSSSSYSGNASLSSSADNVTME
jgi:hypothetical protein